MTRLFTPSSYLAFFALFVIVSFLIYQPLALYQTNPMSDSPTEVAVTHNELAGWHARATPLDDITFAPTRADLAVAVLRSTKVTPSGFTLALFSPDIAVDAQGAVLRLQMDDFAGLVALARSTLMVPQPFQWRVKSAVTCRPIDSIVIDGRKAYGVYNWNTRSRQLDNAVEGYTDLPEEIQTLLELAREAVGPDGWPRPVPELARRVQALMDDDV